MRCPRVPSGPGAEKSAREGARLAARASDKTRVVDAPGPCPAVLWAWGPGVTARGGRQEDAGSEAGRGRRAALSRSSRQTTPRSSPADSNASGTSEVSVMPGGDVRPRGTRWCRPRSTIRSARDRSRRPSAWCAASATSAHERAVSLGQAGGYDELGGPGRVAGRVVVDAAVRHDLDRGQRPRTRRRGRRPAPPPRCPATYRSIRATVRRTRSSPPSPPARSSARATACSRGPSRPRRA